MFTFWHEADSKARRSLVAASLGWMLDSFDVMLYALVVQGVMADLAIDAATGGRLQSYTLLASAAGGLLFGVIADRYGRTRALIWSVLIYSVFTAACGFAQTALQLAVFRVCLGIGMGGEWASGAALVSETWPDRHRGKALAFVQSSWAIGYGLAVIVDYVIRSVFGLDWRMVFFAGIAPALFALWVRRTVEEPELWRRAQRERQSRSLAPMVRGSMFRITIALTLMNAATMFAWWGFNTWVPSYLTAAPEAGGVGLSEGIKAGLILSSQVGMWFGYVSFGYIADAIGRKRTYVGYLVLAAIFVWLYTSTTNALILLAIGPFTAFFATGHFSGFGAVSAELYPTSIRATAQGLTYNIGRVASAVAPWVVGGVADVGGYASALSIAAVAFVVAALFWVVIPETRGRAIVRTLPRLESARPSPEERSMTPAHNRLAGLVVVSLFAFVPDGTAARQQAPAGYPEQGQGAIVKIISTGAAPRRELRYRPAAGSTGRLDMRMEMAITMNMAGMAMPSMAMPAMTMSADMTITEVAPSGDFSYRMVFVEAGVESSPGVDPNMVAMLRSAFQDNLKGFAGTGTVTSRGVNRSVSFDTSTAKDPQMQQAMGSMTSSLEQMSMPLPEESVGAGAQWEVYQRMGTGGMATFQKTEVTLKAVEGDTVTLDVRTLQQAPSQPVVNPALPPEVQVHLRSLKGQGNGSIRLDLTSMIPTSTMDTRGVADMEMSMGGNTQAMTVETSMKMTMARGKQ